MQYCLVNYSFGMSVNAGFDAISSTDGRNLWCAILVDAIRNTLEMEPLFPQDITAENTPHVVCEILVNARKPLTTAPNVALYMETTAVFGRNNAMNASNYEVVLSFDRRLENLDNFVRTNLPCWSPTFATYGDGPRSGYVMISGNKSLNSNECSKDLYLERRKIIKWFESNKPTEFDLFGQGWKIPSSLLNYPYLSKLWRKNNLPGSISSYRGVAQGKYSILNNYTFNICFENCIYPDYVTEKLFDAIISGCVPIYWGADYMENILPKECFVDASAFPSISDLVFFCDSMSPKELEKIRDAGRHFINGAGRSFTHEEFASTILKQVVEVAKRG